MPSVRICMALCGTVSLGRDVGAAISLTLQGRQRFAFACAGRGGDVDGDGRPDLAVGAPFDATPGPACRVVDSTRDPKSGRRSPSSRRRTAGRSGPAVSGPRAASPSTQQAVIRPRSPEQHLGPRGRELSKLRGARRPARFARTPPPFHVARRAATLHRRARRATRCRRPARLSGWPSSRRGCDAAGGKASGGGGDGGRGVEGAPTARSGAAVAIDVAHHASALPKAEFAVVPAGPARWPAPTLAHRRLPSPPQRPCKSDAGHASSSLFTSAWERARTDPAAPSSRADPRAPHTGKHSRAARWTSVWSHRSSCCRRAPADCLPRTEYTVWLLPQRTAARFPDPETGRRWRHLRRRVALRA